MITQERLKELFSYCPDSGVITRLSSNKAAGCISVRGYWAIKIDGVLYKSHRLAFLYMLGEFPLATDHINGDKLDNRWCNLRNVDQAENCKNRRLGDDSLSGVIGVTWNIRNKNWRVRISANKREFNLGSYSDLFEAACARKSAERKYNYHPNHGRV